MSAQLGTQGGPKTTTDPIYTDVVDSIQDDVDFFDRVDVKASTKDTDQIYGVESLVLVNVIKEFGKQVRPLDTSLKIDGSESFGDKAKELLVRIVQMAKDAMNWIMNILSNQLTRIDNRQFRLRSRRKRHGIKQDDTPYPASAKRLLIPQKVTEDGQWVKGSLQEVELLYKQYVTAHDVLAKSITLDYNKKVMEDTISGIVKAFEMTSTGSNKDGSEEYRSRILPGNRYFRFRTPTSEFSGSQFYFDDTTAEAKLKSDKFGPTSFIIDNTLDAVKSINDTIRSNQKSVNELHRALEKEVSLFGAKNNSMLTPEANSFLTWLVRLDKAMSSKVINYVISSADAAMDFVERGINK
jgi:hypothetical protein